MSNSKETLQANAGFLAEIQCEDGVRLNGFLQIPENQSLETIWLIVHGVAGNFYSSSLLGMFASVLGDCGHATLRLNTRGHDQVAFAFGAWPSLIGSAYESIDESQFDLRGWIRYAKSLGYQRVKIIAHSLGAIKSAYYAAQNQKTQSTEFAANHLVLVSPPRLHHDSLVEDPRYGASFEKDVALAKSMIAHGNGRDLMQIKFPQPLIISADTFIDKYGPPSRYDYLDWAPMVGSADWIFGEIEVKGTRMNFANCDRLLKQCFESANRSSAVHVIPNADHNYTSARASLSDLIRKIAS